MQKDILFLSCFPYNNLSTELLSQHIVEARIINRFEIFTEIKEAKVHQCLNKHCDSNKTLSFNKTFKFLTDLP